MREVFQEVARYVSAHQDEMVEKLGELVNIEDHFFERENVIRARDWVQRELEAEGFQCRIVELDPPDRAGVLVAELGSDRPGKPVLFTGHVDTVHYTGSFGKENPFFVRDGKAYGPGVYDMKGGIIIALYVAKALNAVGYNERPVKMIIVGDEEYDHVDNNCNLVQLEESKGALCSFHIECGVPGKLITGRKSQDTYHIEVTGEGGHAGNEFWVKKNALHELLPKLNQIIALTNKEEETTVSVTVCKSGEHWCAIPDYAEAYVDVRFLEEKEAERVRRSIESIAAQTFVPGTVTDVQRQRANFVALKEDEQILGFLGFVNRIAEECGFEPYGTILRGGANDSGTIHSAGIPVLDGCGIDGFNPHNITEYALIQSMYDKVTVFASAILASREFEEQN